MRPHPRGLAWKAVLCRPRADAKDDGKLKRGAFYLVTGRCRRNPRGLASLLASARGASGAGKTLRVGARLMAGPAAMIGPPAPTVDAEIRGKDQVNASGGEAFYTAVQRFSRRERGVNCGPSDGWRENGFGAVIDGVIPLRRRIEDACSSGKAAQSSFERGAGDREDPPAASTSIYGGPKADRLDVCRAVLLGHPRSAGKLWSKATRRGQPISSNGSLRLFWREDGGVRPGRRAFRPGRVHSHWPASGRGDGGSE